MSADRWWRLAIPQVLRENAATVWFLTLSLGVASWLLVGAESNSGDVLNRYSDHLHHVRATWTFFKVGLDVYTKPFGQTAPLAPYPYGGIPWPDFPMPYPIGMYLVY